MALKSNALITLLALKDALEITDSTKDSLLEMNINSVSQKFEKHLGRKIKLQTITSELMRGTDRQTITLKYAPIKTVIEVKLNGSILDTYNMNNSEGYLIKNSRTLYRQAGWPSKCGINNQLEKTKNYDMQEDNIEVTYQAGYEEIPSDIEEACMQECIRSYQGFAAKEFRDVQSKSMLNASVTFNVSDTATEQLWLKSTLAVLNTYKRFSIY